MINVQTFGGPTALFEYGDLRLLTDPTFDEPQSYVSPSGTTLTKLAPPKAGPETLGRVDVVLLSHDQHADNLDDSGRALLGRVPLTLTTVSGAERLGGTARGLAPWESTKVGDVTVTGVPARHGPEGCEPLTGEVTGFVLTGEGLPTVYVSGDNAALDAVEQIAARFGPVDTAILFAGAVRTGLFGGALLTLDSEQAAEAARVLGAKQIVLVHHDSWAHFTEGRDALVAAFTTAGLLDRVQLD
ncbi:MBL fold metallo-hydrolase [Actinoplanes regularis]|uniref:L-ascorbate metabolism protein UlaG, beta-lactamase superfamily n=1 Tax=Actinoplanes regularis TaxID=52697 RepID=A0A238YE57_9ACTN|nr:MBL fold metallo-hydrolase [Actinoplanes regularis]GIE85983.1 MBL fold metallo-hydrolase [Actinoplanes regularis]GLW27680.1 MBL fold metallo-hydrolase [Actinoplanes regularis]SNR69068.1 L-ascorbate metabolism protein UlaG, beta-lactamase superfamily [Actinoplanes regularis]